MPDLKLVIPERLRVEIIPTDDGVIIRQEDPNPEGGATKDMWFARSDVPLLIEYLKRASKKFVAAEAPEAATNEPTHRHRKNPDGTK